MGKLNIAMLRQLIIQKFGTAKQFCEIYGITENGLQGWYKTAELADSKIDRVAEMLGVDSSVINQSSGTIDADQFMATLKEIRKVAERTGADPLSDDMIQWAIFCMAPGETVAANEKIIEKALKLKGA